MLQLVMRGREADLGHGLKVRRLLPQAQQRHVGPFVFLDHAGPVVIAPEHARAADVRPHPHIGLSTVSYLLGGEVTHRDSLGVTQVLKPGDVNWMTAGRGISHSERCETPGAFAGKGLELMQFWVGLPEADEEVEPSFVHHPADTLPEAVADGVWMRLIAGEAYGLRSPVATRSPLFYLHTVWQPGATAALPGGYTEQGVYVLSGAVEHAGQAYSAGDLLVFDNAADTLRASETSTLMLFGGEPLGQRFIWWNFVSSRKERIEQAKADWQSGVIPLPPHDNGEFIPLPA